MMENFMLVLSPALGAGLPRESVPLAAAVQEPESFSELNGQVPSAEAFPSTALFRSGVKLRQEPPPATLTFVIALSPVFVSVTTTVMVVFGSTVVPGE